MKKSYLHIWKIGLVMLNLLGSLSPGQAQSHGTVSAGDTALFAKICGKMKQAKGNYTIGGVINMKDPVNPDRDVKNAAFTFCKQGDDFYYKLGETETINGNGLYLYIDNKTRHIMLSAKKQVVYDPSPVKPIDLRESIRFEHYTLSSVISGPMETLTLLNEHHLSCKQYSITFKRDGLNITRLFIRMPDAYAPDRRDKETTVDVRITQWDHTGDITKYKTPGTILVKAHGKWRGSGDFKSYKIIEM